MKEIIEEINRRVGELESDKRHNYPPALVQVNAPLALIQVSISAQIAALKSIRRWIEENE